MPKRYQRYWGLLVAFITWLLLAGNFVYSQIVQPRANTSGYFYVNVIISDPDGCGVTVSQKGSKAVAAGSDLALTVIANGCSWTYHDDRGGSGVGVKGVIIAKICQDINATFTFAKPTPMQQGTNIIQNGQVVVTELKEEEVFPPLLLTPTPNASSCIELGESCSPEGISCCGDPNRVGCIPWPSESSYICHELF
jgi:hypothetical protein